MKRKKGLSNCITLLGPILKMKAEVAAAASVPRSVIWNEKKIMKMFRHIHEKCKSYPEYSFVLQSVKFEFIP